VCGPPAAHAARCLAHVVTHQDSAVPLATVTYQSGFGPADLKDAYKLPTLADSPGSGPTVAIVDAYDNPNAESDLAAYRTQFQLGDCTTANGCFKKVNQNGVQGSYPAGDTGWGAEIDLDIEMVAAACPACKILLVEAKDASFTNLMTAVDYAVGNAQFVSNSYGAPEFSGETTFDSHFNHTPNVGITVSSGDDGYGVQYPAASRYVTAVGGTSLTKNTGVSRGWSETAWSGAGSGCSALEQKPAWQHDTGCTRRTVADVSAVANPSTGVAVYDSFGSTSTGNWFVYGGTSVASPFVAAVWALGPAVATTSAQIPYLHTGGWYDVTSGSNTNHCRSGYLCKAVGGFDGPTGLGTPTGASGFGGTVGGGGGGGNTPPVASFSNTCTDLQCSFTDTSTDPGGSVVGWSWTFGDTTGSTAQNPSHNYASAGTYTVSLTVTDNGGLTNSTSKQVTVTSGGGGGGGFQLTASGRKVKGVNTVDLSWTGVSGSVDIYRNNSFLTSDSASPFTDSTGTKGSATFTYKVCVPPGTSNCSNTATVVF
jgi:PKD repeat protein